MSRPNENPVSAWSRRRAAVKAETRDAEHAAEQAKHAAIQAELEQKTDDEILTELNLQDPDTLQPGDDFTGFMQSAVPERLRRRALRMLWRSNPVLANVDNLVDYGEDFKAESLTGAVITTAYQVGKGMLKHTDAMEAQAAQADLPEADETPEMAENDPAAEQDIIMAEADHGPPPGGDLEEAEQYTAPPVKRRMRFAFEAGE